MDVCMYVCMYACMYVCMHACMHVCIYIEISIYIYVVIYVSKYATLWHKKSSLDILGRWSGFSSSRRHTYQRMRNTEAPPRSNCSREAGGVPMKWSHTIRKHHCHDIIKFPCENMWKVQKETVYYNFYWGAEGHLHIPSNRVRIPCSILEIYENAV